MKSKEFSSIGATVLAGSIAVTGLSGCNDNQTTIKEPEVTTQITEQTESENEMVEVTRVFEPGTHVLAITYFRNDRGTANPTIPEGYELFDYSHAVFGDFEVKHYHTFVFVNTVEVEVKGVYNSRLNEIEFNTPGTPVEEAMLSLK